MAMFADTHCHLDLYPDMLAVAHQCETRAIRTIAVTNLPSTWEKFSKRVAEYQCIRVALGIHPQLAAENSHELNLFLRLLPKARYVGEIGLDGSREAVTSLPQQKKIFEVILRSCAEQQGKILTIHSRGAAKDVIEMIELCHGIGNGVVLHWFTGSAKQMFRAVELGCYFSINSQMVASQSGIKMISQIPTNRIVTETDGPFISIGREPAKPWHVVDIVTGLGKLWQINSQQANERVAENFKRLLESAPKK